MGKEVIIIILFYVFYNLVYVCIVLGGIVFGIEFVSGWEICEWIKVIVKVKFKCFLYKCIGLF